jgi:hypothetical protein
MNPDLTGHWNGLGHGRIYLDVVGFTQVGSETTNYSLRVLEFK